MKKNCVCCWNIIIIITFKDSYLCDLVVRTLAFDMGIVGSILGTQSMKLIYMKVPSLARILHACLN